MSLFSIIIYIIISAIGFMMVYLYKQTNTTAQFFKPNPRKILKAFTLLFVFAIVLTYVLSYAATNALTASNIPDESSMQYQNIKSIMFFVINLSFLLLIVLANAYSLALKELAIVPYLLTLGFYGLFIIKDGYYIADYYTLWQKSLQIFKGDLPDLHQAALVKCALGLMVTAFNAFFIWLGLRK